MLRQPHVLRRPGGALRSALLATLAALAMTSVAPAQAYDPEEASVRQLRKATAFSRSGLHHAVLLALRDLRDPAMGPLFQTLAQGEHWSIQVDAILGLAELAASGRIDPWLLSRLRSDQDRADAIRVVLELERVGRTEVEALLEVDDIPSVARIVLLAELRRLGGTPDSAALMKYAEASDAAIAGLASCLLADLGKPAALAAFGERLKALPQRERDAVIEEIAIAARRYEIKSAIDLLAFAVGDASVATAAREAVVSMALALDPSRGVTLWQAAMRGDASPGGRVRWGLLLLIAATKVPPATFDAIANGADGGDNALLGAIADAGRAMASGGNRAPALNALYDLGHRRACRYVIAAAEELDPAEAAAVYAHILARAGDPALRSRDLFNDCIDASARMADRAPEELKAILDGAEDDGPVQEAILMGLANSRSPAAGDLAASVRRIGAGRSDSVALVVLARHRDTLAPEDLVALGRIAGGGGHVDETLQAQAAWLWLKHTGKLESAMPKVVAGVGGEPATAPPGR